MIDYEIFRDLLDHTKDYGHYIVGICPFHEDTKPSLMVSKGGYNCWSCGARGSLDELYRYLTGEKNKFQKIQNDTLEFEINKYHEILKNQAHKVLGFLKEERGISEEVIDQRKIGFDGKSITIPIFDINNKVVNIRKYTPRDKYKMRGIKGRNSIYLYPVDVIVSNDKVYVFEGEGDTLLALSLGLPAVTFTSGATATKPKWLLQKFKHKRVVICYDIDTAGKKGAYDLANELVGTAKSVSFIWLPLTGDTTDKDFTDFIIKHNHTLKDFLDLPETPYQKEFEIVGVEEIINPQNIEKRIKVEAQIIGFETTPYFLPARIKVGCAADMDGLCVTCPLYANRLQETDVPLTSALLEMINKNENFNLSIIKKIFKIPQKCKSFRYNEVLQQTLFPALIMPVVGKRNIGINSNQLQQPILCFSTLKLQSNKEYNLIGIVAKEPKTQKATFIIEDATRTNDMGMEQIHSPAYQNANIADILDDIEKVTGIYGRREMLLGMLLILHLPLYVPTNNRVGNGFSDALIIGDTREGKSEAMLRIMEWYGKGEFITAEHSSYVGLVGGVMKSPLGQQLVKWGRYPANDGGFLALDECSGLSRDDIGKMSGLRSSGIAEVTKVATEKANARVRAVWLSNPPYRKMVADFGSGIEIIKALIGAPEDIARFNFIQIVAKEEVNKDIKLYKRDRGEPEFLTREKANQQINWVWSLAPRQIKITDINYLEKIGKELVDIYDCDIPLINSSEIVLKLSRLACAYAGLVGSVGEGNTLIVLPQHIDAVREFLDMIYQTTFLNLKRYAKKWREERIVTKEDEDTLSEILEMVDIDERHFAEVLLKQPRFTDKALVQMLNIPRDIQNKVFMLLIKHSLVHITSNGMYEKTEKFNKLLKMIDAGLSVAAEETEEEIPF